MDNQCCPSPDYPVILGDTRAKQLRLFLKWLYYGQMLIVVFKMVLFGAMAGLFQLVNLWVIYTAYATMHFCAVLIYLIMCCFDILFILVDWKRLTLYYKNDANANTQNQNNTDYQQDSSDQSNKTPKQQEQPIPPVFILMFIIMAIYYIIAVFYSYRAYGHYKLLFIQQVGGEDFQDEENNMLQNVNNNNAQPSNTIMRVNNEVEDQYQREQRRLREQYFQRREQAIQRHQQQVQQQQSLSRVQSEKDIQQSKVTSLQQQHTQTSGQQQLPLLSNNGQQQITMHDFRKSTTQAENNKKSEGFQAFQGTGHKLI